MKSRKYLLSLMALALFLAGSVVAYAQAPIRGKVQLKKADGSVVPVEGLNVDVYRTDTTSGKLPSTKTDAKGEFVIAAAPAGQIFAVVISGPGIKPEVSTGVRAGNEISINLIEGGGEIPSEADVREALALSANPKNAEEAKKLEAERQKKIAEIEARNKKIEAATAIITRVIDEGTKAFKEKNWDLAIAKFEEGVQADPEFVGTAPVLLNNKAAALRQRAVENYNTGVKSSDAAVKNEKVSAARKDFEEALAAHSRAYQILKNAQPADIKDQNVYNTNKYTALNGMTEVYRLLAQTRMMDSAKAAEAKTAFQEYIAIETDAAKKAKAQFVFADVLREAGDFDNAVPEFRRALEADPNNADVLAGLGLSLFAVGEAKQDQALMQEGLNYMEKFTQVAPANHPLKADVAGAVTYLKTERKLTPQKVAPGKKRNN